MNKEIAIAEAKYPDAVILMRYSRLGTCSIRGDKATPVAKLLGLIVSRHTTDRSLFCAFREYKLDTYLPKMVHAGYRVIILEAE